MGNNFKIIKVAEHMMFGTLLICPILLIQLSASEDYYPPPESQGGWRSIVPPNETPTDPQKREILNKTGLDWDGLRQAWDYDMKTVGPDSRKSLLIIRHGWIAFEQYYSENNDYSKDSRARFASGTKTLVGVSLARLFSQNRCKDTDYVYQYMPASWAEREPARKKIQIRHILSMSSGLEPYDGPYDPANYGEVINNLVVVARPGKLWFYNTGALDLLNYVIADRSGKSMEDFLNLEIMQPIDGDPVYVQPRFKFNGYGFCSFYEIKPRDYARIGYLLLKNGRWKERQIIEKEIVSLVTTRPSWLAKAASVHSVGNPDRPQENYAYTFWLNQTGDKIPGLPSDAYMASGGNHKMIVIPSLDMIIARVGNYVYDYQAVNQLYRIIRQAVTDMPAGLNGIPQAVSSSRPAPGLQSAKNIPIANFRNIPSGNHLEIEVEGGICVPPMRFDVDSRNRQKYAWVPKRNAANYNTPGGPAKISLAFHLPETKAYNIWIRTIAPDSHSDSYFLSMDGNVIERPWYTLVVPQSREWQWTKVTTSKVMEAGNHVLEFRHRESGIKLDKIIVTSDMNFMP